MGRDRCRSERDTHLWAGGGVGEREIRFRGQIEVTEWARQAFVGRERCLSERETHLWAGRGVGVSEAGICGQGEVSERKRHQRAREKCRSGRDTHLWALGSEWHFSDRV